MDDVDARRHRSFAESDGRRTRRAPEHVPVHAPPRRVRFASAAHATGGLAAIGVKELRGRMRGRRAFVILTIYLVLLASASH